MQRRMQRQRWRQRRRRGLRNGKYERETAWWRRRRRQSVGGSPEACSAVDARHVFRSILKLFRLFGLAL
eukprot:scaffold33275_cov76-Phaeocystis_antarctica.AAC.7